MVVAGIQIGEESGFALWRAGSVAAGRALLPLSWDVFAALALMIVAKEAMGNFSRALGRTIHSGALAADAWHHRSDALSTAIVIVGLGGRNLGLVWLDGAAGLLVALWIVYTGTKMAIDAVSPLLGEMAPPEEIESLRRIALSVPGVVNTHDIKVHNYGQFHFTTLHCELSDRLGVHKMHEITVLIETRILKRFPGECVVHMDPVNLFHPLLHRVSDIVKDTVVAHPQLVEFRDLNLWSEDSQEHGEVEVSIAPDTPEVDYPRLQAQVGDPVRAAFPTLDFTVHLKVDFSAAPLTAPGGDAAGR